MTFDVSNETLKVSNVPLEVSNEPLDVSNKPLAGALRRHCLRRFCGLNWPRRGTSLGHGDLGFRTGERRDCIADPEELMRPVTIPSRTSISSTWASGAKSP